MHPDTRRLNKLEELLLQRGEIEISNVIRFASQEEPVSICSGQEYWWAETLRETIDAALAGMEQLAETKDTREAQAENSSTLMPSTRGGERLLDGTTIAHEEPAPTLSEGYLKSDWSKRGYRPSWYRP